QRARRHGDTAEVIVASERVLRVQGNLGLGASPRTIPGPAILTLDQTPPALITHSAPASPLDHPYATISSHVNRYISLERHWPGTQVCPWRLTVIDRA